MQAAGGCCGGTTQEHGRLRPPLDRRPLPQPAMRPLCTGADTDQLGPQQRLEGRRGLDRPLTGARSASDHVTALSALAGQRVPERENGRAIAPGGRALRSVDPGVAGRRRTIGEGGQDRPDRRLPRRRWAGLRRSLRDRGRCHALPGLEFLRGRGRRRPGPAGPGPLRVRRASCPRGGRQGSRTPDRRAPFRRPFCCCLPRVHSCPGRGVDRRPESPELARVTHLEYVDLDGRSVC